MQWGVKGSCVPKLRGLSVTGETRRTRRNMISFKTCDSEVLMAQHPQIWTKRQTAEITALARALSSECNVSSSPTGAARSEYPCRTTPRPLVSVAPPPAAGAGGRVRADPARVRALSVQLVCEREWEVAGLRLRPSLLTEPARRLQP